jgi:hypothetical protein
MLTSAGKHPQLGRAEHDWSLCDNPVERGYTRLMQVLSPGAFGAFLVGSAWKLHPEKTVPTLLKRPAQRPNFLASKEGCYSLPKRLRFAPMGGCSQAEPG